MTALAATAATGPAFADQSAAMDRKTAAGDCERWGRETGVEQAQFKGYVNDCVRELLHPDQDAGGDDD